MLNDYYAISYLNYESREDLIFAQMIIDSYKRAGVKKIKFAYRYDPCQSPEANIVRAKIIRKTYCSLRHSCVDVDNVIFMPLMPALSKILSEYDHLLYEHNGKRYVYLSFELPVSHDVVVGELHDILYKLHLTPIITSFEKLPYIKNKETVDTILSVPNAIYEINIASLQSQSTKKMIKDLYRNGKTFIFGSGDRFDSNLYQNIGYYEHLLEKIMGKQEYGYYSLLHNKLL